MSIRFSLLLLLYGLVRASIYYWVLHTITFDTFIMCTSIILSALAIIVAKKDAK